MALYVYKKEDKSFKKKMLGNLSYVTLVFGALLLFWAFYPVVSFEIYSFFFIKKNVIAPIPSETSNIAGSVLGTDERFTNNVRDYTQASIWFPKKPQNAKSTPKVDVKEYYISIPRLNIEKAKVIVGGDDLLTGLIHYLPSSLPGEPGNVAIFGHSTLPQLHRDRNTKRDYKSIFTFLPSLKIGDKIIVTIDESDYEFQVFQSQVVKPEAVSILDQQYDASYLTVVTCTPPGTYKDRFVLKAKLVDTISKL